jgi:predicted DNA-binding WGR domain protein
MLLQDKQWIGWCKNPKDNSDKVWGVILVDTNTPDNTYRNHAQKYAFCWGRRGKTLQLKVLSKYESEIDALIRSKVKKGYTHIPNEDLADVYPEFEYDIDWVQIEGKIIA